MYSAKLVQYWHFRISACVVPGILPVLISTFMSFTSSATALGNASEMYTFGTQGWFYGLGSAIAYSMGPILFVPLFYPLQLTSVYEVRPNVIQWYLWDRKTQEPAEMSPGLESWTFVWALRPHNAAVGLILMPTSNPVNSIRRGTEIPLLNYLFLICSKRLVP